MDLELRLKRELLVQALLHPARVIPFSFLLAILLGTLVLSTPYATAASEGAPFLVALFTATSAVCVTGLTVVDTGTYWSGFGQTVIMALFQLGGFGIMTAATLLGLLVSRRLGLKRRLIAQSETRSLVLGDVGKVVRLVAAVTLAVEGAVAGVLAIRLGLSGRHEWPEAIWQGAFHAVSAFNNAGFSTYADNLMSFALDPWVLVPIMLAILVGGIGFPVIADLRQEGVKARNWSLHTKLTLTGSMALLVLGAVGVGISEWANPATLGGLDEPGRVLNAVFHSVMPRTAGFNSIDMSQLRVETLALTNVLMFIGGGSAGTAGGIKVTTIMVLLVAVAAEVRGEKDTVAMGRRLPAVALRQALAVIMLALACVVAGSFYLLAVSEYRLEEVLFEAISAFATVGLSTGITANLPISGQVVLIALMYIGRVGIVTVAAALALRHLPVLHRYPEERPIIG